MLLVISVMTSLAVSAGMSKMQKAGLARCFAELRSIQARISADSMEGGLPDPDTFWKVYWHGTKPGPYVYLVDDNDPRAPAFRLLSYLGWLEEQLLDALQS